MVIDVDVPDGPVSLASLGETVSRGVERLLLRTSCSIADGQFPGAWPWLEEPAVEALLRGGLKLLGVDCPSVDGRDSKSLEVHRLLFKGGASILENLDLRAAPPAEYHLTALPIRFAGLDAVPVRAVLRRLGPA